MWYGGNEYCLRFEQIALCDRIIKDYNINNKTSFKDLIKIGLSPLISARIRYLLRNPNIRDSEYE